MVVVLVFSLAVTIALVFAMGFAAKKIQWLREKVSDLEGKLQKPFGLVALERVGDALGGLSKDVVRAAYAAAEVCERPNAVAEELAKAQKAKVVEISRTRLTIDDLKAKVANEENKLRALGDRVERLTEIEGLLPN